MNVALRLDRLAGTASDKLQTFALRLVVQLEAQELGPVLRLPRSNERRTATAAAELHLHAHRELSHPAVTCVRANEAINHT